MTFTIALAGNPNAGKSTIFNHLTGTQQHVGNWPGKTVERKEGVLQLSNQAAVLVDLPGTYSLTAFSAEEIVTRNFILDERPHAVIAVVDAANLERNLYLVMQLLELGVPLILALNMCDIAEKRRIRIDTTKLSKKLGNIPVISMVGSQGIGLDSLKKTIEKQPHQLSTFQLDFHPVIEKEITRLETLIQQEEVSYPARWLALKLLEVDSDLIEKMSPVLRAAVGESVTRIIHSLGDTPDILIADSRYAAIESWLDEVVARPGTEQATLSDRVDQLLIHPFWGVLIFMAIMWLVFQFTANVSAPYVDWIDGFFNGPVAGWAHSLISQESWLNSLVVNGLIGGVGSVLTFIPVLFWLYLVLAVLEDSGYMSRAALVMDRFMQLFGLHGKSVLPLIVGFGCSVPAIYATRTLENPLDRKITAFLVPFMSCGARLPVYVLFGATFFGRMSGNFIFGLYLIGIGVATLTSLLMTRLVFPKKQIMPLVIELPPYRVPTLRRLWLDIRLRVSAFIQNAGTIILAASLLIWFLLAVPTNGGKFGQVEAENSLFYAVSKSIAPVFAPAGFGEWQAGGALITGFAAKEAVIATMSQVYTNDTEDAADTPTFTEGVKSSAATFGEAAALTVQEILNIFPRTLNLIPGMNVAEFNLLGQDSGEENDTALEAALKNEFSPAAAIAFNVFILLYIPCMATIGAMRQEFGTRWMLLQAGYSLGVAWLVAVLVYQVGSRL
ncbi:MAG: ferrous iron transport protein B [Anaerolineae bacterium]|nr:ferrous iron transport protein B [Anaerolineae bacterium]